MQIAGGVWQIAGGLGADCWWLGGVWVVFDRLLEVGGVWQIASTLPHLP
jgi:hypothetical protein